MSPSTQDGLVWPRTGGWWYARLHPGGLDRLDRAVSELLAPVATTLHTEQAERWFFIRYTDLHGPHLRLRVKGDRALLDRLQRRLPALTAACYQLAREPVEPAHWLTPLDTTIFRGTHAGAATTLYEPEWEKYGGPAGVTAAERLFEHSSDIALRAATAAKTTERAPLTVLLMRASVAVVGQIHGVRHGSPAPAAYWERHLFWWTRDAGPNAEAVRADLRTRAAEADQLRRDINRLYADPDTRSIVAGWSRAVIEYLHQAARQSLPKTPGHLIFHQNHMMANRLGILPREEALLGIVAAGYS